MEVVWEEDPLCHLQEKRNRNQETTGMSCCILLFRKLLGHQRGRGSLRSISVLDRLLLTVPVWLQLSINPATALHILRREPPGNFLVRKSRTSQRNVLCVRLADDSVPSFVQQFGIIEEQSCKSKVSTLISDNMRLSSLKEKFVVCSPIQTAF
uniref:SH2 domain-containing protein n=1 Tax=Amphiprion percula TaxID=161767 RepID=A0A3P8TK73_AMPPE